MRLTRREAARNPCDSILFCEASRANNQTPAPPSVPYISQSQPGSTLIIAASCMALQPCSMVCAHIEAINNHPASVFAWLVYGWVWKLKRLEICCAVAELRVFKRQLRGVGPPARPSLINPHQPSSSLHNLPYSCLLLITILHSGCAPQNSGICKVASLICSNTHSHIFSL